MTTYSIEKNIFLNFIRIKNKENNNTYYGFK